MTERRVNLSLFFTSTEAPGTVLRQVLAQLDPALTATLSGTNAYAFDPTDHTDETRAFLVLSPAGNLAKIHVNDEDAATNHAKAIDGLLVELPVTEDFRAQDLRDHIAATKES